MPRELFNKAKFRALLHYICYRADVAKLGSTKLNKILWYADSLSYIHRGHSLTGEMYQKDRHGPIPHHYLPIMAELERCGDVVKGNSEYHGYNKTDYHCSTSPDMSCLEKDEIELVDALIGIICEKHTAVSISELTHDRIWELADVGEEIPYCATLAAVIEKPSEAARNWAFSVSSED